jgi:glycosyltransferase involved in cell wall biosynthesis
MFTDSYWPRVNGIAVSVESFACALLKLGHEVLIICPYYPETPVKYGFSSGMTNAPASYKKFPEHLIIRVPSMPILISKEDRLSKSHKLFWVAKQLEKFAPDIIHIQSEFVTAEFGYYCGRIHKIPVVYTYHTLWGDYMKNYIPFVPTFVLKIILWIIESNAFRRAYRVIVPSEIISAYTENYKMKKTPYLLPTGIDDTLFYPREPEENDSFRKSLEAEYPGLKQKRILLFAGRIAKEKNLELILKVAPLVVKEHGDVVFLIVGNGPDIYWFKEECESLGLTEHFIFTGYFERTMLARVYCVVEIFIFPSRTETQGLVTIEAMLSGIPVVAVGERGTFTVMCGDNGGFMVPNDADVFAARVNDLLRDRSLYERKSAEALEYGKKWTIGIMAKRLEDIYVEAIEDYKKDTAAKNRRLN